MPECHGPAALGVGWYQARYLCMLAAVYAQTGQAEAGLRVIAEAKDLVARNDEHMWEGELDRIEGELRRVQGASASEIETCFAQPSQKPRSNAPSPWSCAPPPALRGSGVIRASGMRPANSRSGLRLVHRGFDTRDLKEAKALLDGLAS